MPCNSMSLECILIRNHTGDVLVQLPSPHEYVHLETVRVNASLIVLEEQEIFQEQKPHPIFHDVSMQDTSKCIALPAVTATVCCIAQLELHCVMAHTDHPRRKS